MVRMPAPDDEAITESIWWVFSSRMRLRIAGVAVMISKTGTIPPSTVGTSCWLTTACSTSDSCMRIWRCWLAGKASMMRSTVEEAPVVCSVENRSWAISAAVMAVPMVSWSRISPSRMTSGASRIALRSASA